LGQTVGRGPEDGRGIDQYGGEAFRVSFLWLLPLAVRYLIGVIATFSSHRKEALLYFVQSIFLLFSAMYIAKEALEIALMSGAGSEGGHGHGHGHGHSHGAEDGHETSVASRTSSEDQSFTTYQFYEPNDSELPSWLLVSAALATFLSATVLHNHTKLVEGEAQARRALLERLLITSLRP
jgi:hypothetical protein